MAKTDRSEKRASKSTNKPELSRSGKASFKNLGQQFGTEIRDKQPDKQADRQTDRVVYRVALLLKSERGKNHNRPKRTTGA